jgi:uncharacterized membrane protein
MRKFIWILLFLLCINIAYSATIHGTVYDLSLRKVNNAIVEIDTEPNQRFVAIEGDYSFSVPIGDYKITAFYKSFDQNFLAEEELSVKDEGDYVFDLFLFPSLSDNLIDEEFVIETDFTEDNGYDIYIVIFAFLLLLLTIYYYKKYKKPTTEHRSSEVTEVNKLVTEKNKLQKKEEKEEKTNQTEQTQIKEPKQAKEIEDVDLDKLVNFIKKHDGRTTQKDIRKEFPLSEAKISLMITELEHKGVVNRIKKGRGNVIILSK